MIKKIILTLLAAIYALSPYDFFPDFFVGWGWLDDLFILYLLWRYVYSPYKKRFDFGRYYGQGQQSRGEKAQGKTSQRERPDIQDPYSTLGIDNKATKEEIRKAYKELVNRYHPDKVQHLGEEFRQLAEKRFKEIQQAYQHLTKD